MATFDITHKAVILRAEDDVAVAKAEIPAGTVLATRQFNDLFRPSLGTRRPVWLE